MTSIIDAAKITSDKIIHNLNMKSLETLLIPDQWYRFTINDKKNPNYIGRFDCLEEGIFGIDINFDLTIQFRDPGLNFIDGGGLYALSDIKFIAPLWE
jgi:hypothetical protein